MGLALSDVVQASVSASSATPTVQGFGKTLCMVNKVPVNFPATPQTYTSLAGLITAGFLTTDDAYLLTQAAFSANPAPPAVMIAQRTNKTSQVINFKCTSAVIGAAYALNCVTPAGVSTAISYTVANPTVTATVGNSLTFAAAGHTITASTGSFLAQGFAIGQTVTISGTSSNNGAGPSAITALTATVMTFSSGIVNEGPLTSLATITATQTTAGVANAINALINAVSGFAGGTTSTNTITIASPTAGTLNGFNGWTSNLYLTDTTTDPGIAADLATAIAGDNTWYGLQIDSPSKAEILAAAAFCEANKKLFTPASSESNVPDNAVSNDVLSTVQSSSYHYTSVLYNGNNTKAFSGMTWQSGRFAGSPTPGNDTWMYNTLPGTVADALTETQSATLGNKFGTGYATMQGVNITVSGGIANSNSAGRSGSGEFLDVRRFLDWELSQIQLAIFIELLGPVKTAFTDKGLAALGSAVLGALQRGEQTQGAVLGSSQVLIPTAASVAVGDRQNRIVRNLNWSQQIAGAVHLVISAGTVTS